MLLSHLTLPRVSHLQQVYHIFGYLKKSPRRRSFFDLDYPRILEGRFQKFDWVDFYKGAKEDIPINALQALGCEVDVHCFVDASHACDKVTRRSQSGILIFTNKAPIILFQEAEFSGDLNVWVRVYFYEASN